MIKHISFAACLLIAGAATAQEKTQRSPEEVAKERTARLTTVLELTPEQTAKVQALHMSQAKEAEARKAQMKAEREAKRAEMEKKRAAHEAEMKSILTAEQFAKWEAMREKREDRKEGMRHRSMQMEKREQMKQERKQ